MSTTCNSFSVRNINYLLLSSSLPSQPTDCNKHNDQRGPHWAGTRLAIMLLAGQLSQLNVAQLNLSGPQKQGDLVSLLCDPSFALSCIVWPACVSLATQWFDLKYDLLGGVMLMQGFSAVEYLGNFQAGAEKSSCDSRYHLARTSRCEVQWSNSLWLQQFLLPCALLQNQQNQWHQPR